MVVVVGDGKALFGGTGCAGTMRSIVLGEINHSSTICALAQPCTHDRGARLYSIDAAQILPEEDNADSLSATSNAIDCSTAERLLHRMMAPRHNDWNYPLPN